MIILDVLWWVGWAWFALCAAAPLALVSVLGPVLGVAAALVLAPWSTLIGTAALHHILPASEPGRFRMFADRGAIRWALKGWAPSVYLTVFQPVFFLSPAFQRIALLAFGAQLAPGARVTTRTSIREPQLVRIGRDSLVGEFVQIVCAYQPRPGLLHLEGIVIGDGVLIGAHSVLAPGARVGDHSVIEYDVTIGARATVGAHAHIGSGTRIFTGARVGHGVVMGKGCLVLAGATIPDDTRVADGVQWKAGSVA